MRKVLKNNKRTNKYLNKLEKIYLVACWADYGVIDYYFTGKYKNNIPLVYQYEDFNGTVDIFILRKITSTNTGNIIMWTKSKSLAYKIAEAMRQNKTGKWIYSSNNLLMCNNCKNTLQKLNNITYCPYCGCNNGEINERCK